MKKSIFLFFAAILCAMTANAQWALMGTLTDWSSGKAMSVSGTDATCTVDLPGQTTYTLKVKNGNTWYGRNSTTISATTTTSAFSTSGGDVTLNTDIPGTYTFSFNTSTKKLTVTYPTAPAPHDITVRAQVPASWTNTITAWVWTSENGAGEEVTPTKDGDYYVVTKNAGALYVIFKNGAGWNGDKNQTVDLCYTEDVCLQLNQSGTAKATATVIECGAVSKDITVKAVVPGAWENTITAWVWPTGGEGKEVTPTKDGNWYVVTENCIELNVIFKNGTGWNGNENQTANITGVSENTCYQISAINKDGEGKCTYTVADCGATIEPEAKPVDVYTVVGSEVLLGTEWDLNNADNEMTKQDDGSYVLVKENVDLATTGTYEYKVVKNHDWAWSVPSGSTNNTLKLGNEDVDGTYNVTFTLNKELNALTASLELVEAKKVIPECYVAGDESLTGQNWNAKSVLMTYDEATEVYTATLTAVPAGTHNMKVVYGGEWLGFDHLATPAPANVKEGDDKKIQFTLAEAGDVTVTYHATNGIGLTGNFAVPVTYDYYIAGTLAGGWSATQQGMEKDGELYKATFTELNAGTYQFKITDGQFNTEEDKTHEHTTLGAEYEEVSYVDGNIQIITEEAKNITIIFDATANKITIEGLTPYVVPLTYTVTVPAGTEQCYIAGSMNGWAFQEMEAVTGETNKFTITIVGAKETDEYKYACQANWDYAEVREADENGNSNRKEWKELDEVTAWNKPVVYTYYLMGVNDDWTTGIEMTEKPDQEGEYMLTCQPVNGQVKIKRVGDDDSEYWFGGKSLKEDPANLGTNTEAATDGDGNIELAAGKYNFYFDTKAEKQLWIAAATDCPVLVTVEDVFGTNTYTGVEENGGVWSKEYNVGDEVTLNIASLDPELVFAYWSVGAETIFTEEYTFTATEDVTVTAVYALPMEVTFDNMALDTESWIVEAGPDAEYGVTVTLFIDVEGDHPKGFGLVDGSQIYLGKDELELVTGYFTAVDQDAPSAEAVIFAVYAEELMAFVCTMSGVAAPAVQVEVLDGTASVNGAGELTISGNWDGDDVYVVAPGFNGVTYDCDEVWFYVGGTDFETASIIAFGPATITVEDGVVTVEGTVMSGMTVTNYDLSVSGTFPAAVTTIDVTLSNMVKSQVPRMGRGYTSLEDAIGNSIQIYNESAEWAYGEFTVTGKLVAYGVTVQGNGTWAVVDGVETLTATLQVEDDNTTIYNVTATVEVATTITLECMDATYTITDPELNEVTFTGIAAGKEFTIVVAPDGAGYYSDGEWDGTPILGTAVEFDNSDPESYSLGGTYIDDASNTYEVAIFGAPAVVEPTPDHTREVPVGYYATMCLPNAISYYEGAEIYEVAWMEFKDDKAIGLYLDQVAAGTTLEAGKPYIFKATTVTQEFYYEGEAVSTPVDGANGLRGTLEGIAAGSLTDNYIIAENKFWVATASNYLDANRAYIDATAVNKSEPAQIPGRRRVSLGAAGENAETGIDNIITTDTPVKVIENGQLIIIRNGEKFNVQGIKL